ncbi:hypothetical protein AAFC00_001393 [Neodothiora populina]|uniref:G protein-coupled receptor n=1 Tax=Neodothiora populina TaxID=2781224 RepID=A0ABR3PP03_9PEZI
MACDDAACSPAYLQRRLADFPPSTIAFSSIPFALTFLGVASLVWQKLFPLLTSSGKEGLNALYSKDNTKSGSAYSISIGRDASFKRIVAFTFSTTIALSAVLVELILCEISNLLNPAARGLALRLTLLSLLVLIVIIIPALAIHSWISAPLKNSTAAGYASSRKEHPTLRYMFEAVLLGLWLLAFWYMPHTSVLPSTLREHKGNQSHEHGFTEACLGRIGIIGISLMASLAGFAAVSSIWQTFGVRQRPVRETDLSRKESGLTATQEMLATKESRLRALQRKMSEAPQDKGFMNRMMGSFGGNADTNEQRILEMEIAGLETMSMTISSSLATLRSRYTAQKRSHTSTGRLLNACNFVFSLYCLYRIAATSLSSLRRWWQPDTTFATSDPINNILALLTTHYDPTLDREAWSRQFSFLLSGVMLLASFNAVLQTFRLFSHFFPSFVQRTQTSLPLIISQIAGAFVISQALLLRSNLPSAASNVITEALGTPLERRFVEGWFESWFLVAVGLTSVGVLISRKLSTGDWDDWDDVGDVEMGKMS